MREFDATNDKHLFEGGPGDQRWPVYKSASFNLWEPATGTYYAWADPAVVVKALQEKRLRQQRLARSAFSEFTRDWASDQATLPCFAPRIAFRDITNRLNVRTTIAALVPGDVVLSNQAPYLLWSHGDERDEAYLLGVLCSIPLDWYARRVVERHLNFHIFNGLPVPRPERDDPLRRRTEIIAGRLAAVDGRFAAWAEAVGVEVGSVTDEDKPNLIAELDAVVACLYGLNENDVRVIFETFHVGWDYAARLAAVLEHFRALA